VRNPNQLVYAGGAGPFYEVFYLIFNDPEAGHGFWLRTTLLNPQDAHPASGPALWAGFCDRENPERNLTLDRAYPGAAVQPGPDGEGLTVGTAAIGAGRAQGEIEGQGRSIAWDLTYEGQLAEDMCVHEGLARKLEPRVGARIPYPRALFSGTVTVDGETIAIDRLVGHQAHHWGQRKMPAWAWGHACDFPDEPGAVVEVLHPSFTGGPITGPLFCNARLGGRDWKLWELGREGATRVYMPGHWRFRVARGNRKAEVTFTAEPDTMLDFLYFSPRYAESRCRNSPLCRVSVALSERGRRFGAWSEVHRADGWGTAEVVRPE